VEEKEKKWLWWGWWWWRLEEVGNVLIGSKSLGGSCCSDYIETLCHLIAAYDGTATTTSIGRITDATQTTTNTFFVIPPQPT